MLAVPAAIACADVGDLEHARRCLAIAELLAARWEGTVRLAGVREASAHVHVPRATWRSSRVT
jgi:hypothetical protein